MAPPVANGTAVPALPAGTVAAQLVSGPKVATTPSTFWGVVVQANCGSCIATNAPVGAFLNQTPFTWFRYSEMSDNCNLSANALWGDSGKVTGPCGFSIPAFKRWCDSRTPACHSIIDLPGENNNSGEVGAIARYIVHTVGFQPDFWSIGNEPMLWTHYGIPWSHWSTSDHSTPSPLAYAVDVRNGIAAVRSVDPGARIIGVQAACECNTAWFQDTVKLNGPQLSAIAYHTYPSTALSQSVTLAQFYAPLQSTANLPTSFATVRSAIRGYCSACATLPIFVDEFNAGPGWGPSNFAGTYANAEFLAASVVQALRANVTQLATFDLQTYSSGSFGFSMMNAKNVVGPTGVVFSQFLRHLDTGTVYATGVRSSASGVYSVLTRSGLDESLLVVNTNLAHPISLSLGTIIPLSLGATTYEWSPATRAPTVHTAVLASRYTVPAQGMLIVRVALALAPSNGSAPLVGPPASELGVGGALGMATVGAVVAPGPGRVRPRSPRAALGARALPTLPTPRGRDPHRGNPHARSGQR